MAIKNIAAVNVHLFLCNGSSCLSKGAEESTRCIRLHIAEKGLDKTVHTTKTYCNGRCADGPIVIAMPEGKWFKNMIPENTKCFVENYLVRKKGCANLELYQYGDTTIKANTKVPEVK